LDTLRDWVEERDPPLARLPLNEGGSHHPKGSMSTTAQPQDKLFSPSTFTNTTTKVKPSSVVFPSASTTYNTNTLGIAEKEIATPPAKPKAEKRVEECKQKKRCHHCKNAVNAHVRCQFWNTNGLKCLKPFCDTCLMTYYDVEDFGFVKSNDDWFCPSGLGYCLGATCSKDRERNERRAERSRAGLRHST